MIFRALYILTIEMIEVEKVLSAFKFHVDLAVVAAAHYGHRISCSYGEQERCKLEILHLRYLSHNGDCGVQVAFVSAEIGRASCRERV